MHVFHQLDLDLDGRISPTEYYALDPRIHDKRGHDPFFKVGQDAVKTSEF